MINNKETAIVLGGPHTHADLVCALKRRGYHVVLIDYLPNPPARMYADTHLQISTLDVDAVLDATVKYGACVVIDLCLDQPLPVMCQVAERLNLPAPYGSETALKVTNKLRMKETLVQAGIATSKYVRATGAGEFDDDGLRYPLVVKPVDATGSSGVKKCSTKEDVLNCITAAIALSRQKEAIIEEYCKGIELNAYALVVNGVAKMLMASEKSNISTENNDSFVSNGSVAPYAGPCVADGSMQRLVSDVAGAFKLRNTPLLVQCIVVDGKPNVIEVAARLGGGTSYRTLGLHTGLDVMDAAIDAFLGKQVSFDTLKPAGSRRIASNILFASEGVLGSYVGHGRLLEAGIIEEFIPYKIKGHCVGSGLSNRNRVGAFIAVADDEESLFHKIEAVKSVLDVLDCEGKSILRKDLILRRQRRT